MQWLIDTSKRIGQWFFGKEEDFEKLNDKTKLAIHEQARRMFWLGFGLGMVFTAILIKTF